MAVRAHAHGWRTATGPGADERPPRLRPRSFAEVAKEAAVRDREMSRFEAQHPDLAERV